MSLTPLGDIGIALKADIDDYSKAMASASDATGTLRGMVTGLTSAVRNTGLAMTVASGIVGGAMVGMAMNAQQVSSAFREVDTISREVTDAQAEYGALVSDLNTQFGLQADRMEVIDGLYQSVSAGVTEGAEAQREFLETAAQLAVVGRVDLATTVDVLSTVMNTYGLNTEQAQDVSESLFQTVQFGKVRMEELAPVLGRVAALGSEMGTQIDEIGAAMAVLTRTGFEARVAATGLRNIFRTLMRPSEDMEEMLRSIALENDFFAESMGESEEQVRQLAQEYRNATESLTKWENKQAEARATTEEASLALQEARLKIQAIEEDRLDQLPELTNKQVKQAESIKQLETVIDNYQFKINKSRVQEEKARQETEKFNSELADVRKRFKENVDAAGDLESNIGSFVLQNQNLIETLVELQQKSENQDQSFSNLIPRTRALQAALALVGEDGQALTNVFDQMESGTLDAREAWEGLDESARQNFESFEAFKASTEDVQQSGLQDWFQEATGEQATMRNSIARLKEAIQDLGAVFSEDVTEFLQNFANSITKISEFAKGMSDAMRSNISRFFMLATALGLVIGPLLLVGGQFALIAQALGPALIPFLAVSAGLFGALAAALKTVVDGGKGAEGFLGSMSGALQTIRYHLRNAYGAFKALILPELINFGGTLFGLFGSIAGSLSQFTNNAGGLAVNVVLLANAIGKTVEALDEWFVQNEEKIVATITKLADILVNRVIPDLIAFAAGVLQVIANINPKPFIAMAIGIGRIVLAITDVLGIIGRWMQRNDQLLGTIVTIVGVLGTFAIAGVKVLSVIGRIATVLGPAINFITILARVFMKTGSASVALRSALNILRARVLVPLIARFGMVAKGASIVAAAFKYVAAGASMLASFISLPMVIIGGLIALFAALVASAYIMRDELRAVFQTALRDFKSILGTLGDAIGGEISWKEAGRKIVETLVSGLFDRLSLLRKGAKKVADTVKDYLGFGSSPPALGEDYNPKTYGENVTGSFSTGMLNEKGKIKDSAMGISDSVKEEMSIDMSSDDIFNFEQDAGSDLGALERSSIGFGGRSSSSQNQRPSIDDSSGDVTIEEKAVYFEKGAFQGVSDEEIPQMVDNEVQKSLDDIVEEMRGSGRDSIERY